MNWHFLIIPSAPSLCPQSLETYRYLHFTRLYLFSLAAAINHHKLTGFKQQKSVILQFWKSEVLNKSHWASIRVSAMPCFSLKLLEDNLILWLFQLLEAVHIPWLMAPSSTFKSHKITSLWSFFQCSISFYLLFCLTSIFKGLEITLDTLR